MKFKSIYTSLVLASLLLCTVSGIAQDAGRKISLDEAIALSVQNSKALRSSYTRLKQAEANTIISKQNQLPDLKITGAYMRVTEPGWAKDSSTTSLVNSNILKGSFIFQQMERILFTIFLCCSQ